MKLPPRPAARIFECYAQSKLLPAPRYEGEWCVSPGGDRFRVGGAFHHAHGRYYLWWELCTPEGVGRQFYFRLTPFP